MIHLSKQDLSKIAEIVREETGNQVLEKNYSMIEARMRAYLDRFHYSAMSDYWKYFSENERQERDAIAGLMTTHYTFFFREFLHFEALEGWINSNLSRLSQRFQKTGRPVQIWSAACSRGQEVYSLAMFMDYHLSPHGIPFHILGTDIDQESVSYAKNAVYPLKEVNSIPLHYLAKHVRKGTGSIKEFAAIHPDLKKKTDFRVLNLMDLPPEIKPESFDIIFCRNVFIYFSEDRVRKIASDLANRLAAGGLFFSGISEPLRFEGWALASFGPSIYVKNLPAEASAASPKDLRSSSLTPAKGKYSVLCVDDSPTIQKLMTRIFQKDPDCQKVDLAANGQEASELLKKDRFDLITLDIHMPVVNGIEFLERFYRRETDPPVIMISSVNRSDVDLATKALSLGAFDYVEKPSMNQIEKSGNEILGKAKIALKSRRLSSPGESFEAGVSSLQFDREIGKKIVVPDASRCLRILNYRSASPSELEQVIRAQKDEYRSPGLVVLISDDSQARDLQTQIASWTDRPVEIWSRSISLLKPNRVYIGTADTVLPAVRSTDPRQISLQIIGSELSGLRDFLVIPSVQILLSESQADRRSDVERSLGRKVADLTPATSFASLSVEYFALLRSAAA